MIEKCFDKTYECGVSQSTLTKAANRLIAEYCATFGSAVAPEELQEIAKQIKQCVDTTEYEERSTNEYRGDGSIQTYDTVKYVNEARARAFWDTDEYNDPVYCVTWYFFSSESYTKRIGDQIIRGRSYNEILRNATAAKGKFRYFCTHRPPTRGGIPDGFISYDTYGRGLRYIGEVTYNEQPPESELRAFGLVLDPDWEKIRTAYMGELKK